MIEYTIPGIYADSHRATETKLKLKIYTDANGSTKITTEDTLRGISLIANAQYVYEALNKAKGERNG